MVMKPQGIPWARYIAHNMVMRLGSAVGQAPWRVSLRGEG